MSTNGRDLRNHQKCSREEIEVREDEEEIEMVVLFVGYLVCLIGAWYHTKYMLKEPSCIGIDERARFRGIWMRYLRDEEKCFSELQM